MATTSTIDKAPRSAVVESNRKRSRILIAAALVGLALGGGAFGLTRQSNLEAEQESARWQVYEGQYWIRYWAQLTPAEREAAGWQALIEQYDRKRSATNR